MPVLSSTLARAVLLAPRPAVAAPPSTPTPPGGVTTNLVLWLEGDQLALADGAAVSSWTDKSSVGNHATQATSTKQPTYRATGGPNSLPTVEFDGGDGLATGNVDLSSNKCSFYIVANVTSDATDHVLLERSTNYNSVQAGFICFRQAANTVYVGAKAPLLNDRTSTGNLQATHSLVSAVMDRDQVGVGELSAYLNGTAFPSGGNLADQTTALGSSQPIYVGARATTSLFLIGKITLVLVYNAAHDTTTRQAIQSAISTKYALGF